MRSGGELIREARKRAGLSQQELAERLGTTQSVIARWETGARSPTLDALRRAVRACGFTLNVGVGVPDPDHELLVRGNLALSPTERLDRIVDQLAGLEDLVGQARRSGGASERRKAKTKRSRSTATKTHGSTDRSKKRGA